MYHHIACRSVILLEHRHLGRAARVKGTRELVIVDTPYIVAYQEPLDCVTVVLLALLQCIFEIYPTHYTSQVGPLAYDIH